MKGFVALLCVLWACPVEAQSRDGWPTHLAISTYMTLQGADLSVTSYLLGAQQGRELNPVLSPFSDRPVAFGIVKMGTASATSYLLLRIHKRHPKLAFTLAMAGNVLYAGVVTHNARLVRQIATGR